MKQTIATFAALVAITGAMLGAGYYGMSKSLCARIDTFTAQEQADMKLTADVCDRYYR